MGAAVAGCAADAGDLDKAGGSGGNVTGSSSGSASATFSGTGTTGTSSGYGASSGASSGASGTSTGFGSGTSGSSSTTGTGTMGITATAGTSGATGTSTLSGTTGTSTGGAGTSGSVTGASSAGADSGPPIVLTPSSLEVLFAVMSGNAQSHAEFELDVVNHASTAMPLADVTLRYWFTADGNDLSTIFFQTYYSANTSTNATINADVDGTFAPAPSANVTSNSDAYMEISFSSGAGSLPTNGKATIQCSWNGPGANVYMDMFDEANDYSFDANDTASPVQSIYVTAYVHGSLVWGIEPGIPPVVDASTGDAAEGDGESAVADGGVDATLEDSGGSEAPDATAVSVDASTDGGNSVTPADAGAPPVDAAAE
ncbi:MAG TPA: cellulose binding domain-containing protein [Polyangiaceae bacterium]|nr:cellulose binding domain-containing protein [Polyangiaceae bacterium]